MLRLIIIFILFRICWKLIIEPIFINKYNINKNNIKKKYNKPNNKNLKNLTTCNVCNIYLPAEDAVYENGKTFCCNAHAEQQKS